MNIKSIVLEHTNPSLGPHEKRTTVTLFVSEKHKNTVDSFIKNSIINHTITLYEYFIAVKSKNSAVVDNVENNKPNNDLRQGETISHLSFYFEDNSIVKLHDVYRVYNLSDFKPEFTSYMVKEGDVSHFDANSFLESKMLKSEKPRKL